jgi:4-hydroxybenzoate-CoA ligase
MAENGNAACYFVDRHVDEGPNDKLAFVESGSDGRNLTYGELVEKSGQMVDFYQGLGIAREDRVAMITLDTIDYPVLFWGSLKAGVIPVLINTLLSSDGYRFILEDSRAKVLFISAHLLELVQGFIGDLPFLQHVFIVNGEADGYKRFDGALDEAKIHQPCEALADEIAFWLYSSGSTGMPKGVCHVHSSLQATSDTYGKKVLGIQQDDVTFSAAKLFFAYGLGNGMTFPMAVGATSILLPGRPTPQSVLETIAQHKPSIYFGVPTLYAALLDTLSDEKPAGFENLRLCVSAGEALPQNIGTHWQKIFGVEILDGVGSTELLHIFLSNQPGQVVYGTSGMAVPGYQLRLVDELGGDVGEGEVGELLVNAPSAAEKYWNQRQKTRDTFEGHWVRTGDKYTFAEESDGNRRYTYGGRTDDMFKVSGIWVSPFEVEQALASHASVLEAAVVAAVDENELIKPKAYVVLNSAADTNDIAAELKELVKEKIGKWKYPRWIEIVDDLPKTATGKVQRFKLRDG